MNIETLRDLLIYIMKNRTPASILCDKTGMAYWRHDIYGGCTVSVETVETIDEIVTVQKDFVIFKRTNKSKAPTRPILEIIPISKIEALIVDQDFLKGA